VWRLVDGDRAIEPFVHGLAARADQGPASTTPTTIKGQRSWAETPEATTPHPNAHIGGNQVRGLSNSVTAEEGWKCHRANIAPDTLWNAAS
jgi:hypothetical protein